MPEDHEYSDSRTWDSEDWLEEILREGERKQWCVASWCTLHRAGDLRGAYLRRAARFAGIEFRNGELPDLNSVSAERAASMFEALIAGARQIGPRWRDTRALRVILMDLNPPFFRWGVAATLTSLLEGTPAGDELLSMEEHEQRLNVGRSKRRAYENPESVAERRADAQRQTAERVATRLRDKVERAATRQEFLDRLASMSVAERLVTLAAQEGRFPLDMIPRELVPLGDESESLNAEQRHRLIQLIGRRKGWWGRLRESLKGCGG